MESVWGEVAFLTYPCPLCYTCIMVGDMEIIHHNSDTPQNIFVSNVTVLEAFGPAGLLLDLGNEFTSIKVIDYGDESDL